MTRFLSAKCKRRLIGSVMAAGTALFFSHGLLAGEAPAETDYLSAGEVAAIGGASAGALLLGTRINNIDSGRATLIAGPLPLEVSLQHFLGGSYQPGKTNFLDGAFGSALTPAVGGLLLVAADMSWPASDRGKETAQDFFLYASGLAATKGLTDISKGFFARPRPMIALSTPGQVSRPQTGYSYNHQAFFSGHASSAFFSMAYLNKRVRSIMRRELSNDDYRDWRWVSSTIAFGWASFVGWSRVHAYKHYVSDVIAGALAGWLVAELFYSFGDHYAVDLEAESQTPLFIRLNIPF